MTSFIEWTGPKGSKTQHDISASDGSMLFAAGLWETAHPDDDQPNSYTMVMMEAVAGDDMHRFHNRQPVLLDRAGAHEWLDHARPYEHLLRALPPSSLNFDPPEPVAA